MAALLPPKDMEPIRPTPTAARIAFCAAVATVVPDVLKDLRERALPLWTGPRVKDCWFEMRDPELIGAVDVWAQEWHLDRGTGGWRSFMLGTAACTLADWYAGGAGSWTYPPLGLPSRDIIAMIGAVAPEVPASDGDSPRECLAQCAGYLEDYLLAAGWRKDKAPRNQYRFDCLAAWQCGGWTQKTIYEKLWPCPGAWQVPLQRAIGGAARQTGIHRRWGSPGRPKRR